jgi:O-antigen ligase
LGEGTSAGARVASWLQAIQVIVDHPVFGIGFNAYRYAVDHYGFELAGAASYGVDGGLLFIMAMTGIVGLTVYCLMLWLVWRRCRGIRRDAMVTAGEQGIAIGTAASILAVVTASAFVNAILTTFVMEILWVLWALTFVIDRARLERSTRPSSDSTRLVSLAGP